jgi:hypothetical protein
MDNARTGDVVHDHGDRQPRPRHGSIRSRKGGAKATETTRGLIVSGKLLDMRGVARCAAEHPACGRHDISISGANALFCGGLSAKAYLGN